MPTLNNDNLTKNLLPPNENSELAASLFLYQLALKDKAAGGELFGPNICIKYKSGGVEGDLEDPSQHFKLVSRNGVYASGSSKVDKNSEDFKRLSKITQTMNKYFKAIDSSPKVTSTGFTDGEAISGRSDTSKANSELGLRRAGNLASALGLSNVNSKNYISENGQKFSGEKSRCESRRVTTLSFQATPKIHFGSKGAYTPSFKMIKDHKVIKKHAMFSALSMLGEHNNNINEVLKALPAGCNNSSTRKILKSVKKSVYLNKNSYKYFSNILNRIYPGKWDDKRDNAAASNLKYYLSDKKKWNRIGSIGRLYREWGADKQAGLSEVLAKVRKYEIDNGYRNRTVKMSYIKSSGDPSDIPQSNHSYDCFDVKDYYKTKDHKPEAQDVSNFVRDGKLEISFTKDDFSGHGNHLRCNQCKSGMSLGEDGEILRNIRTSKVFTDKSKIQKYNPSLHADASKTIKLASLNNFNSMASHKSMKVVVIKNCEDKSRVDVFSPEHEILTINSLPFKKTINVADGANVCVVNMPVINTCTIEPKGQIASNNKPLKKTAHYYNLDGKELSSPILGSNLSTLEYINQIVNSESFTCHNPGEVAKTPSEKTPQLDANEVINSISCDNKGIVAPAEDNNATEDECPEYFKS
jgi:hypothetical protein